MIKSWQYLGRVVILAVGGAIATATSVLAQSITIDGTLSPAQTLTGPNYTIPQSVGQTVGNNLFQSFGRFNLNMGERANFQSAGNIRNILSRVTGGGASMINGLIFTTNRANVNLFLINPSGIVFGPNARLNVGGSFVASTANALVWSNGSQFSATNPGGASSLLTIVGDPSGFLSTLRTPPPIDVNRSTLRVPQGQSLLLLGGNVNLDGSNLFVDFIEGGRIELGAVAQPGTVGLNTNGNILSLNFPENLARGDVSLTNGATLDATAGNGGSIAINARNIDILSGSRLLAGIRSGSGTVDSQAGDITLNATGEIKVASGSIVANLVRLGSFGNGGNITIDSGSFSLLDGAQLSASTLGQGNAGNVTVSAKDYVFLADNAFIFSTVSAGGVGKGGNIDIDAGQVLLIDGAQLVTATRGASGNQPAGRGDAGNVNVNVTGDVDIAGRNSAIFSNVETKTVGNAGNITIDSGSFSLQDRAVLSASTSGQGNGGNVTVSAKDAVDLADNANIFSTVEAGGVGKGGNININAATLSLIDGAQLLTITREASATGLAGRGDAGNVNVKVTGAVNIAGEKNGLVSAIFSRMETGTVGNGGNITIDSGSFSLRDGAQLSASTSGQGNAGNVTVHSGSFSLRDGAQLSASTSGQGNAGNVTVRATDSVFLAGGGNILSTVEPGGVGKGGNIDINAATLSLIDGAQLVTITREASNTGPAGRGDAGNVNVKVTGAVNIAGEKNGFASGIRSLVRTGTEGNGGNITINSGSFSLRDRAQLSTSTRGQGNAGNVTVWAKDSVSLRNGNIFSPVSAGGVGKGGNIDINAASLSLQDGAQLVTITREASNTQPAGRGDAGNVNINVTGSVDIAGEKNGLVSGIGSEVRTGTIGNGGNITIDSGSFSLRDGAILSASTLGQGNAGTIEVNAADFFTISGSSSNLNSSGLFVNSQSTTGTARDIIVTSPRVTLDNGGRLSAQSASGNGGNINLQTDLLLLRRSGQISTNAGTAPAGGNGGNINIDAGFIVAVPQENSDITANAFLGNGGTVRINAQGIFGIQPRQQPTSQSDITASSTGGGINGVVDINTLDIDPNRGFINLPTNVVDTFRLVAQSCSAFGKGGSEFTVTGRGGLPPGPDDFLSSDVVWSDTRLTALPVSPSPRVTQSIPKTSEGVAIIPATGWVFDEKTGDVTLIAANGNSSGVGSNQVKCIVP
ncbi:filamentous hemagglutinin N-terminal domain-containing protein [Hassallia byssoidea VB512170]|uniref:Filamentous hemagglutinin N-terminal domain-containing protein n=1 Tax=Hassallia byssoidea VB512170 TaxID=1304833 RepID=A0A846HG18_9CYAN|nr:filamentous hemagglutinin N-terminal domain-containing protein [Hassalia byssoidea]NEU76437.1 filamentous hemagglutinin N-terminal domain-containing protein [Hassalia byssoidea VB512170]